MFILTHKINSFLPNRDSIAASEFLPNLKGFFSPEDVFQPDLLLAIISTVQRQKLPNVKLQANYGNHLTLSRRTFTI